MQEDFGDNAGGEVEADSGSVLSFTVPDGAAGRLDAFFEIGLAPWDIAAGSLLITEAGGLIGDFTGEGDYLFSEQLVAGSPKVFVGMLAVLRPASDRESAAG